MFFRDKSLLSSLAIGFVAACLALGIDGVPSIDLLMRAAGMSWVACVLVFAFLCQRAPAVKAVSEEEYAQLVPPLKPSATQSDLYLDMVKRVLLNIVYHEQSYQIVLARGEKRRGPALAGADFSLADRVAGEECAPPPKSAKTARIPLMRASLFLSLAVSRSTRCR